MIDAIKHTQQDIAARSAQKTRDELATAKKDIEFLIRQFHTIEHMQDRESVRDIAKRYRIKEF